MKDVVGLRDKGWKYLILGTHFIDLQWLIKVNIFLYALLGPGARAVINTALLEPRLTDGTWNTGGWGRKGTHFGAGDWESWAHVPVRVANLGGTTSGLKSRHCFALWTAAGLEAMIQNDLSFCLIWSCDQTTGDTLSVISFAVFC